jgi:hypothetical protein
MALRAVDQLGMDERVIADRELSGLLEKRLRLSVGAVLGTLGIDSDDGTSPTDDGEAPGSADAAAEADALHNLAMAGEATSATDDDLLPF